MLGPGVCVCVCVKSLSLYPPLCDPMDQSPPGSSVHGILQARTLEWVAMPSSRGPSDPGIKPVCPATPALAGRFFTAEPLGKPHASFSYRYIGLLIYRYIPWLTDVLSIFKYFSLFFCFILDSCYCEVLKFANLFSATCNLLLMPSSIFFILGAVVFFVIFLNIYLFACTRS